MSYQKQPELNGAYYGPPIPPPPRSYNRPGKRGGGGCGCCLFDCLCDCIMSCICTILCTILVVVGLIVLVFWLIVRPHEVKFHASDASLTTFNFTQNNNNNLNYNLAVNFTVRNPNRRIGVYYDTIEANAIYAGQRFSTVQGPVFYQGHKNTTDFGPVIFRGQHVVVLGSGDRADYEQQTNDGVYDIQVKMHLRVRFKIGLFKTGTWKPKIKCDLKVPIQGQSAQFERTKCDYDL